MTAQKPITTEELRSKHKTSLLWVEAPDGHDYIVIRDKNGDSQAAVHSAGCRACSKNKEA